MMGEFFVERNTIELLQRVGKPHNLYTIIYSIFKPAPFSNLATLVLSRKVASLTESFAECTKEVNNSSTMAYNSVI